MELLLLGTAAAEGWPAPYCECPNCEEARRLGGPNLRSRSGALIDDDLKIDHNSDTVLHMQRAGRSLARVKTLLITHQHSDHILPSEMNWVVPPFTKTPSSQPMTVYGNAPVIEMLREQFASSEKYASSFDFRQMEPFQPVTTPQGDEVLPLPADHCPNALLLHITRNAAHGGKSLFYGHDSGLYPTETLDALSKVKPLDIILLDCTNGGRKSTNRGHMGVDGVIHMTEELRRRGVVTEKTRVIATHFSHNGGLLHEGLVQAFSPHRIEVAFDGMSVCA